MKPTCKICGSVFFPEPLIRLGGMPKAAQFLPCADQLKLEQGVDLEVCQCRGCGLVQLPAEPVPYYREVVRAAAFSPAMEAFRKKQFRAFVNAFRLRGKKVLEPGCGRGEYLRLMAGAGVKACGLEYSAASVRQCVKSGLKASRGFVASPAKIKGGPFQAFFTLNFLEHLPDPVSFLSGIAANLSEGGVGLVEVPNFDMIVKKKLFSEFIPDHLLYFTSGAFSSLLQRSGFKILELRPVWHDYILSAVVRKRAQLDLADFETGRSAIKKKLLAYISRFKPGRVAAWGAGHQALAVMALAGLGGRLRYVVDSAPFKQGKYTPATHLPIVPPQRLDQDPVDAVIVMAASYSDEVASILRKKYGRRLAVAILRDHGLEQR